METRTFRPTIYQWFQTFRFFGVDEVDEGSVHPSTRFDGVQTAYDEVELHVIVIVLILDLAEISYR